MKKGIVWTVLLTSFGCEAGGTAEMKKKELDHHQKSVRLNRLAEETSPYLLQHARNPVDWYPWGEEAFAKARG